MYLQPIKPFPWEAWFMTAWPSQCSNLEMKGKLCCLRSTGTARDYPVSFPLNRIFLELRFQESPHPGSPSPRWGKGSHHQAELGAVLGFSELEASLHYITPGCISEINERHLVSFNISQCLGSHWRCNHKFPELWTTP